MRSKATRPLAAGTGSPYAWRVLEGQKRFLTPFHLKVAQPFDLRQMRSIDIGL